MEGDKENTGADLPVPHHPDHSAIHDVTVEDILAKKIEESDNPDEVAIYVELLGKVTTQRDARRFQLWQMGMATILILTGIGFAALGTAFSFLAAFVLIGGGLGVLVPEHVGDIMKQVVEMAKALAGRGGTNGNE